RWAAVLDRCRTTVLPSANLTASAPRSESFEAQSHGPQARCLRFAAGITPEPRKTRFRLGGHPWPVGTCTRWIASKGFRFDQLIEPPLLPGIARRTQPP